MNDPLWFIGGDARSFHAAAYLSGQGIEVHCHMVPGLPDEPLPDVIRVLALPFPSLSGDKLRGRNALPIAPILARVARGGVIYGGKLEALRCEQARLVDLFGTEPMSSLNAVPTAEGAILLALQSLGRTLSGAECLVCGYGRCGKVLAQKLAALGTLVTVAARKPADLALARALGHEAVFLGSLHELHRFDAIFNTVPSPVLAAEAFPGFSGRYFELASPPGGLGDGARNVLGKHFIDAQSLPGRFFPITAGKLYGEAIRKHWKEEFS